MIDHIDSSSQEICTLSTHLQEPPVVVSYSSLAGSWGLLLHYPCLRSDQLLLTNQMWVFQSINQSEMSIYLIVDSDPEIQSSPSGCPPDISSWFLVPCSHWQCTPVSHCTPGPPPWHQDIELLSPETVSLTYCCPPPALPEQSPSSTLEDTLSVVSWPTLRVHRSWSWYNTRWKLFEAYWRWKILCLVVSCVRYIRPDGSPPLQCCDPPSTTLIIMRSPPQRARHPGHQQIHTWKLITLNTCVAHFTNSNTSITIIQFVDIVH